MHAIKGGLVGQTYALAKCNDSGGKKSRIRLSKEERKAMVESFIKKYQNSNNGNFPSLNLTHKEVGGSFYIIREIVREIIQENRVLGPAKLTEGQQKTDEFLEQNPLGSISTAPETLLPMQSNGRFSVPSHHKDANDDLVSVTDGLPMGFEYKKFETEHVSGNLVDVTDATNKKAVVELHVIEPLESEKSGREMATTTSKVTQLTTDIVVETFPLQSVTRPTNSIDVSSSEVRKLNENLDQTDNDKLNVSLGSGSSKLDHMHSSAVSVLTDEKEGKDNADSLLGKNSNLEDNKVVKNISDQLLESSDSSKSEALLHDSQNCATLEVSGKDVSISETDNQSQEIVAEAVNASNDTHPKIHGTCTGSGSGSGKSIFNGAVVIESKVNVQHANSSKGSNKTLDRINLESWEETSKNTAESDNNPVWAIFKSFIAAFLKFWSE